MSYEPAKRPEIAQAMWSAIEQHEASCPWCGGDGYVKVGAPNEPCGLCGSDGRPRSTDEKDLTDA